MLAFIAILAVLAVVVWLIIGPLREGPTGEQDRSQAEIEVLETAKEAKYLEIRDAEMELRTGKLSQEDWNEVDRQLRREAVSILGELEALGVRDQPEDR
ncbi:MAG: hypothetical protein WCK06_03335 [Actinomycetota bacterium]